MIPVHDYAKVKSEFLVWRSMLPKRKPCQPHEEGAVSKALGIKMQRSEAYAFLRVKTPQP